MLMHPGSVLIYAGELTGWFVMLSYNVPPGNPEAPWRYFLWRLLIDAEYQRRGYGCAAMALVIDVVRNSPGATDFFTSVHPGDGGPAPLLSIPGVRIDRRVVRRRGGLPTLAPPGYIAGHAPTQGFSNT